MYALLIDEIGGIVGNSTVNKWPAQLRPSTKPVSTDAWFCERDTPRSRFFSLCECACAFEEELSSLWCTVDRPLYYIRQEV